MSAQTSPFQLPRRLWQQKTLIWQLSLRQIKQQYRGSTLGLIWSLITPLMLLIVYTFIFSVVFQARWQEAPTENRLEFGLFLFTGLIVFNLFSDIALSSPNIILSQINFVKRVIFPLESLAVSRVIAATVHSLFSLVILLLALLIFRQGYLTWLLLPLAYLPLLLFCLGLSWFVSSLAVFLRDTEHVLRIVVQLLFFLTPVFYPLTAVPEPYRLVLYLNPLTYIIQFFRELLLLNTIPDLFSYSLVLLFSGFIFFTGYLWFMRTKNGFADVV